MWRDVEIAALKEELRERVRAVAEREAKLDAWERDLEQREAKLKPQAKPKPRPRAKNAKNTKNATKKRSLVEQLQIRLREAVGKEQPRPASRRGHP